MNKIDGNQFDCKTVLKDVIKTAKRCSQFSMCKIDYLSTGLCPSGNEKKYNAFFPQGRMEIAAALYHDVIPVTPALKEITDSCLLCNICRKQCYFAMELNPFNVMKNLKKFMKTYLDSGNPVTHVSTDDIVLNEIQEVVGTGWVSNDPAILVSYSRVRSPLVPRQMPLYVVLPEDTQQAAGVIKIANKHGIPFAPRGNGTSFFGALTKGIVLDLIRLQNIYIDRENWYAEVGAGVSAFELQKAAHSYGRRVNTAEPAACVCANVFSTNLHSLYSHAYGAGADNFIDAEVVTRKGEVFHLNDVNCPNFFALNKNSKTGSPGLICTNLKMKLFPVTEDERALLIPFESLHDCIELAKEISTRRIGFAVGMLGNEYLSNFISPTVKNARKVKAVLHEKLGIKHLLIVICDKYSEKTVKEMTDVVIDREIVELLQYNLSEMDENQGLEILTDLPGEEPVFKELFREDMLPMLRMSMQGRNETIADSVENDMKEFFKTLYANRDITDLRWLTTFRISSARIGRGHMFVPRILWIPLDEEVILRINRELRAVGDKYNIKNDFGYLVPVELGKRAIMEYDYYFDHSDEKETENAKKVISESLEVLDSLKNKIKGLTLGSDIALQGHTRLEGYLYE